MKLLLDENLSPRLAERLSDLYPALEHVQSCSLSGASDDTVWEYAKTHGFAILSKDSDFAERSVLQSHPPKIIWIRIGNCSTTAIEELLRSAHKMIQDFLAAEEETCLLLGRKG